MLTKLSIHTITLYQRYLSPYKGYCCAYRVYTGEDSCSQYAKIAIAEHGLFSAFPLIKEQFDRCSFAAEEIQKKQKNKKKDNLDTCSDCTAGCDTFSTCNTIGDCHPFH